MDAKDMKAEGAALMAAGPPENHLRYVRAGRPAVGMMWDIQMEKILHETPEEEAKRDEAAAECERMLNTPFDLPEVPDDPMPKLKEQAPPSPNGGKRPVAADDERLQPSANGLLHGATA